MLFRNAYAIQHSYDTSRNCLILKKKFTEKCHWSIDTTSWSKNLKNELQQSWSMYNQSSIHWTMLANKKISEYSLKIFFVMSKLQKLRSSTINYAWFETIWTDNFVSTYHNSKRLSLYSPSWNNLMIRSIFDTKCLQSSNKFTINSDETSTVSSIIAIRNEVRTNNSIEIRIMFIKFVHKCHKTIVLV